MFDILGIGELLIDFTPAGVRKNPVFEMNPGGSAANCMAACAALGANVEFAGAVGEDSFGDFLEKSLVKAGIGTRALVKRKNEHSTLAFVTLDENAVPRYTFIKEKDSPIIKQGEICGQIIDDAKIVSFSLVAFSSEESHESVRAAVMRAKNSGKKIGFDANYRERQWDGEEKYCGCPCWNNRQNAVKYMQEGARLADIVKASELEAELITGIADPMRAAEAMGSGTDKLVCVTEGEKGIWYYSCGELKHVDAFKVNAVDTTGCGDSFMGAMLYQEAREAEKSAEDKVRFAAAAAAVCASGFGGIPSMPSKEDVLRMLSKI